MAFIGLDVPADAASLLEGIDVPGDRESASDMHVTIVHLGKGVPVVQLAKAMLVAHECARATPPMSFTITRVSSFPGGDDGVPIICPIESPELQALNAMLKQRLRDLGIPFSDKWPDFKPHLTLGYFVDAPEGFALDVELPVPVPFSVSELCLWGGNAGGPEVLRVSIPFALSPVQRMAVTVARRRVRSSSKRG